MKKNYTASDTILLPQYQQSAAFMERFLIAAHEEGASIVRSPNSTKIKMVDGSELEADVLSYFSDGIDEFRKEFSSELLERISCHELDLFCSVIAEEWFDGKRLRENGNPRRLKRSVYDYLSRVSGITKPAEFIQVRESLSGVEPLISAEAVAAILTVNDQMIYRHVEAWKQQHPNASHLSSNDVFFRRGLALKAPLNTSEPYREWDFINSYSIAFSAPEQFSQMMEGRAPAVVNGDMALFEGRILFFSPFVPGMDIGQLEIGVIPAESPLSVHYQGEHAGIMEYILDPPLFQRD
ncbi:hypothetical protein [Halomonas sp. G11]|uniref:hypothetical protein n=1 Tax=Halomonas sp. G11 TaxID=1684425 RepID=UPI0007FC34AC|nr:hypothetical protein [Halomonas sp. G11]OAZ93489.1 hypothetical protein ADS46_04550 [Halomonas sp. G11]